MFKMCLLCIDRFFSPIYFITRLSVSDNKNNNINNSNNS